MLNLFFLNDYFLTYTGIPLTKHITTVMYASIKDTNINYLA